MQIEGEEIIDIDNLAICVSEATDTIGFGRRNQSEIVSINRTNKQEEYHDSIILPFGDDNGIKRGNTIDAAVIKTILYWIHCLRMAIF